MFTVLLVYFSTTIYFQNRPVLFTGEVIGGDQTWLYFFSFILFYVVVYCCVFMFAFVVCVSFSLLSQEIGWEEHLRSDLFCVGWEVKTLTQFVSQHEPGQVSVVNIAFL